MLVTFRFLEQLHGKVTWLFERVYIRMWMSGQDAWSFAVVANSRN